MSTIRITPSSAPLTSPYMNLMPFHIAHDGPAPISTYFLVTPSPSFPTEPAKPSLKERFLSTFRGRTLYGLSIAIPKPYTGVLLRSSSSTAQPTRRPPAPANNRRPTRSTRKRPASPPPEEADYDADLAMRAEEGPTKDVKVEGVFNSFVLWNPDAEVDPGEDAYMKGLDEWLRLSALVNSSEESSQTEPTDVDMSCESNGAA